MNIGKRVFHRMVKGYNVVKTREYYEQLEQQSRPQQSTAATIETPSGQRIPIIIEPKVRPITLPINYPAPPNYPGPPPGFGGWPGAGGPAGAGGASGAGGAGTQMIGGTLKLKKSASEAPQVAVDIEFEGYEIPKVGQETKLIDVGKGGQVDTSRRLVYPLMPSKPAKNEPILAYAKIYWDKKENHYVYEVVQPKMTNNIKEKTEKIKDLLEEKLDIDFTKLKMTEAKDYLKAQIDKLVEYYKFMLTPTERVVLQYYIERDYMGLGKIEPLMHDTQIEDISCDGIGVPIFVFHRDPGLGSIQTNVVYNDGEELDSFLTKLSQLSGKSISVSEPLLDGALPDGSRLQATLATDIARKGSNFTIRKFSDKPITPIHLLNYKTLSLQSCAYLWLAIDYGRSILVSGGTASGKTSFLNALSLFIRPDKKIISIEDTAELRLPHPHWVPSVARTSVAREENSTEVDMFALLKESLRQRPDYIIVGEVRGQEAFVLFQQMATGHPSYSTIHAEDMDKLVNRLTTAPISLPKTLVGSLDLVVFMLRVRYREKFVRRVKLIAEMIKFDSRENYPTVNNVFGWNAKTDEIDVMNDSVLMKKLTDVTGQTKKEIVEELERRVAVLKWMQERNITEYEDVFKVVTMYYNYPNRLISAITPYGGV